MALLFIMIKPAHILFLLITERKAKMKLEAYHMKKIVLTDVDGNVFTGTSYFCDKEDYDADEDGLEMLVDGNFIIFYQSDIKSIEAI